MILSGEIYITGVDQQLVNIGTGLIGQTTAGGGGGGGGGTTINNATENELVTVASTTSELDAESNLTFDGSTLTVRDRIISGSSHLKISGSYQCQIAHSGTASTKISVDFDAAPLQTITLSANVAHFHTMNRGHGKSVTLRLVGDGSNRTLAFEPRWNFIGEKPSAQAASKTGMFAFACYGLNEDDVMEAYGVSD